MVTLVCCLGWHNWLRLFSQLLPTAVILHHGTNISPSLGFWQIVCPTDRRRFKVGSLGTKEGSRWTECRERRQDHVRRGRGGFYCGNELKKIKIAEHMNDFIWLFLWQALEDSEEIKSALAEGTVLSLDGNATASFPGSFIFGASGDERAWKRGWKCDTRPFSFLWLVDSLMMRVQFEREKNERSNGNVFNFSFLFLPFAS